MNSQVTEIGGKKAVRKECNEPSAMNHQGHPQREADSKAGGTAAAGDASTDMPAGTTGTELISKEMPLLSPGSSLDAYLRTVRSIPRLSARQEKELAIAYHRDGDIDAARQLVLAHLRFVVYVARSYRGYGLPEADLIQEGNIGLMKAVKRFDPMRGMRFITFAVHWIKAEIQEHVLRNWRMVRIATTKAQRKLFFNLRSGRKTLARMSDEEAAVMAEDLQVEVKDVRQMEDRFRSSDLSLDETREENGDDWTPPVALLKAPGDDPASAAEKQEQAILNREKLYQALNTLDDRSRNILQRRWLNDDAKATLQQLAEEYDISIERVRQVEQQALKKLRTEFGISDI